MSRSVDRHLALLLLKHVGEIKADLKKVPGRLMAANGSKSEALPEGSDYHLFRFRRPAAEKSNLPATPAV
jgi:hypothetical protein